MQAIIFGGICEFPSPDSKTLENGTSNETRVHGSTWHLVESFWERLVDAQMNRRSDIREA